MIKIQTITHTCEEANVLSIMSRPNVVGFVRDGVIKWSVSEQVPMKDSFTYNLPIHVTAKFCPACGEELPSNTEFAVGLVVAGFYQNGTEE